MQSGVLVIHGPNLNLLGIREPEKYGSLTLDEINNKLLEYAGTHDIDLKIVQTNHEGSIIDAIHKNSREREWLIINPGAYTHTSIAIRDAILGTKIKTIEIHLSNIYKREPFRRHSYISDVAVGQISGLGWNGYILALDYIIRITEA